MTPASGIHAPPPARFADQVRRAVVWRSGGHLVAQAVQWFATFLVIRILQPADYGLFAMTQVVLVLLNMLNGYGLASGAVAQPDVGRRELGQVFGMLLAVNGALAAAQLLLAPVAAAYYRQPEVAPLLRAQALLYFATPFVALPQALLARRMDFSGQAKANLVAALLAAATALGGALAGWGVWTLVAAPIALFYARGLLLTIAAGGLPRPVFDFRGSGRLLRYGGLIAMGQMFAFLWTQADVFIGGHRLSAHELGIYSTSLFLAQIFVSKLAPPVHDVAFAAYARLRGDPEAAGRAFLQFARVVAVAAMPFHIGLAATAEPLVLALLGPRWAETAPVVGVLALATAPYAVFVLLGPATDGLGRPDIAVGNGAAAALIAPPLLFAAVRFGPLALAAAWLLVFPALLAVGLRRALPVIGVGAGALGRVVGPPAMAALAMGAAVVLVDRAAAHALEPAARLAALVALGAAVYGGWLLLFARDAVAELAALLRRR